MFSQIIQASWILAEQLVMCSSSLHRKQQLALCSLEDWAHLMILTPWNEWLIVRNRRENIVLLSQYTVCCHFVWVPPSYWSALWFSGFFWKICLNACVCEWNFNTNRYTDEKGLFETFWILFCSCADYLKCFNTNDSYVLLLCNIYKLFAYKVYCNCILIKQFTSGQLFEEIIDTVRNDIICSQFLFY